MHFFVMIKLNDNELQYFGNINNVCIFIHIFHLFCTKIIGWECSACISSPSLTPISPSLLIFIHRSSLTVFLSLLPLFFLLLSYCLSQFSLSEFFFVSSFISHSLICRGCHYQALANLQWSLT